MPQQRQEFSPEDPKGYIRQDLRQFFVFKFIFEIHMLCADKIFQETNTSFYFCQMAVEPHGSAIPVEATGSPISSAESEPPNRGFSSVPNR